jgi:hypothetical protein
MPATILNRRQDPERKYLETELGDAAYRLRRARYDE